MNGGFSVPIEEEKPMAGNFCSHCGNAVSPMAAACPQCGHPVATQQATSQNAVGQPLGDPYAQAVGQPLLNPYAPLKSRVTAGVLGILIGGIGIHKFYLGKVGLGVLYAVLFLFFWWTFIPTIIGLVEGIIYLTQTDQEFAAKQGVSVI
jgi:TM2 domain-containing membrane protein YozV